MDMFKPSILLFPEVYYTDHTRHGLITRVIHRSSNSKDTITMVKNTVYSPNTIVQAKYTRLAIICATKRKEYGGHGWLVDNCTRRACIEQIAKRESGRLSWIRISCEPRFTKKEHVHSSFRKGQGIKILLVIKWQKPYSV